MVSLHLCRSSPALQQAPGSSAYMGAVPAGGLAPNAALLQSGAALAAKIRELGARIEREAAADQWPAEQQAASQARSQGSAHRMEPDLAVLQRSIAFTHSLADSAAAVQLPACFQRAAAAQEVPAGQPGCEHMFSKGLGDIMQRRSGHAPAPHPAAALCRAPFPAASVSRLAAVGSQAPEQAAAQYTSCVAGGTGIMPSQVRQTARMQASMGRGRGHSRANMKGHRHSQRRSSYSGRGLSQSSRSADSRPDTGAAAAQSKHRMRHKRPRMRRRPRSQQMRWRSSTCSCSLLLGCHWS